MLRRIGRPPDAVAPPIPQRSHAAWLAAFLSLTISGCVSYEPAPLDPVGLLAELRAVSLDSPPHDKVPDLSENGGSAARPSPLFDSSDGLTIDEAAGVAVTHNPALRAMRAKAGVAAAQLVEAGLLPDPTLEYDISEGSLDGLLPLLRPGERDARIGEAGARMDEVRLAILVEEWKLKRDVHLAFIDLLAAMQQRQLNEQLQEVASRTHDFFLRAREQGAATALQETTAAIQSGEVRLARERLALQERRARQALNELLGLPPHAEFELQTPGDPFRDRRNGPAEPEHLTDLAIQRRPDLKERLATYERSEQHLRLAISMQWPGWTVGSVLELSLPLFSRFNRPAIETAWNERQRLALEVEAAIHALRAQVHDAVAALELSSRQVEYYESEIEPRLAESLRLAEEAFRARHVTAGEILIAQGQVLDAREHLLDARIARARARAIVAWVTGDKTPGGEP